MPLGRPHTGQNAICGTIHVHMVLCRRRRLKEFSLPLNTTIWQFKTELALNFASFCNNSGGDAKNGGRYLIEN